jgi:hypothetical protein
MPEEYGEPVPGWTPPPWPEPVTLTGRYVTVLPLDSAYYSDLFAATCGPGDDPLWTYRTIERPTSLPTLWMHLAELLDSPTDVTFALVPTEVRRRDGPRASRRTSGSSRRTARSSSGECSSVGRCSAPEPPPRRSTC